jgi:superfamily II DNA or RNA helicase
VTRLELRPYQQRAVDHVRSLRGRFRIGLEAPNGSGKTLIMSDLLRDPVRQIVFTHRAVLLEQISRTLTACGIPHGFRASGRPAHPQAPIQLGMIQTEIKRHERQGLADVDLVHIDEIHCQRGPKYADIFGRYYAAGANILGYTATPSDLGDLVDDVYRVATVPELIERFGVRFPAEPVAPGWPAA